MKDDLVRARA